MSHHSEYPGLDPGTARIVQQRQTEADRSFKETLRDRVGATGLFPEGKLAAHDEGQLAYAVGHVNGKVVVEFGKEISSLGMGPKDAVAMAQALLDHARQVSDDVLTMAS